MPLTSFLTASTKAGRRFVRLGEKDIVVMASVPEAGDESVLLVSDDGHVIHFPSNRLPNSLALAKESAGSSSRAKPAAWVGVWSLSVAMSFRSRTPTATWST